MAIILDSAQYDPTPLPVRKLSAIEACERALRKIGAYAINDEAADPDEIEETLYWLDLIVAEVTGTRRCYWLTPATVTFDWPDGESSVVLADQMGADYPPTGILFPVRAWLVDYETGDRQSEIELCRRRKYEELSISTTAGSPEVLYIDRLVENQKAYVSPVPDNADNLWKIALEFQAYSRSVLGEQGGDQAGDVPTGFDQTWQLWMVTRLAAEIGDGPVKRLEASTIRDWRALSAGYLSDLLYTNREKNNRPYQTKRYGG
ncbi:MAG: hypothetical protein ABIH03_07285 [Pseudomonadota bacterium]